MNCSPGLHYCSPYYCFIYFFRNIQTYLQRCVQLFASAIGSTVENRPVIGLPAGMASGLVTTAGMTHTSVRLEDHRLREKDAQMLELANDFRNESETLFTLLEPLSDADYERATLFKGWTFNDILGHLHHGNILANLSLNDEVKFHKAYAKIKALRGAGAVGTEATSIILDGIRGRVLLRAWRDFYGPMSDRFSEADPKRRVKWVGPDMSVRSSITARLMETWSHGQAAFDLLGVERQNADRIKNVAVLGINTFGWTFTNRGQDVPESTPHVRLTGPSGHIWEWNNPSEVERVEGSAVEFCQVVTQTRNIGDTALNVTGAIANKWMNVAQCFAGPPRTPPATGTRHMTTS